MTQKRWRKLMMSEVLNRNDANAAIKALLKYTRCRNLHFMYQEDGIMLQCEKEELS